MRTRTQAREIALQYLYQADLRGEAAEPLDEFLRDRRGGADAIEYARRLAEGVRASRAELDAAIVAVAENWDLNRMAAVDRNVLRLGAWEILHGGDVPRAVAINEAVDMVKKFSKPESGAFVNGLLDKIVRP
jgi:transcription antitermination factor NusB